ncbi:Protein of unknown function [Bacillus thuringiensis]|uniref:Uncharacterized protein n=1 Tax=Bacillus thuringiensis TaxID=1428 RepID=A0A1C4EC16_BACTU|nr:Protein of unknown function [Bacillus thuringiensis]
MPIKLISSTVNDLKINSLELLKQIVVID